MVPSLRTALLGLASAAAVGAQNALPPIPYDSQTGEFLFPVTCEIDGFVKQTFNTLFTATAPLFGGPGQENYYGDVVGHIDIPNSLVEIGNFVGATQAQINFTVYLNLTNASPAEFLLFSETVNNVPLVKNSAVRVPEGNGTFPPLGPVTLGAANTTSRILIGDVNVGIQLQNSKGQNVLSPIPVTCGQQNIDFIIGSVNINDTVGLPPYAPTIGYVPEFLDTPVLYESGNFRFGYDCDFGPLGPQVVDFVLGGTTKVWYAPGEIFYMTNATSFIIVGDNLVKLAKEGFPTVHSFDTTVTAFDLHFSNASPDVYNVATNPIVSNVVVGDTDSLVIPLPYSGLLPPFGPFTAGAAGNVVSVSVGDSNATTVLRNATGHALFELPITCHPPSHLELIGIPISSVPPGNYQLGINES